MRPAFAVYVGERAVVIVVEEMAAGVFFGPGVG